jgi:hypothetical protein
MTEMALATPPALVFPTVTGEGTSDTNDDPLIAIVANDGNATLTFNLPTTGDNPSLSTSNFTLDGSSTCTQTTPTSSTPFTLAEGAYCILAVDFTPQANGTLTDNLSLTDNTLNATSATQQLSISGTAEDGSTISSPTAGSTLTSASTTFTWNAGPAGTTGYGLNIGTTGVGSANLVNIGPISGTSVTVSLPTNGTTDLCAALDNPQRHVLPRQRLHLHRVHAICIRDLQPHSGQHVDLGFNHLHLERRSCWNDVRPQYWHYRRRLCGSGQHQSPVRYQCDSNSAHQWNQNLCAALDNLQRPDLRLQRLHLHRVHATLHP